MLSVCGGFPFDDDPEQEPLDLFQWRVCAVEAVTTSRSALLSVAVLGLNSATPVRPPEFQRPPIGDLVFGSASEHLQIVDALRLGVVAVSSPTTTPSGGTPRSCSATWPATWASAWSPSAP